MTNIVLKKDGKIVSRPRILFNNGVHYLPPTDEQLVEAGYEFVEEEIPEPSIEEYLPSKEELVESKIRERYSINKEFEVQRKRDVEPDNFQTYYNYVEECINWANQQNYRLE